MLYNISCSAIGTVEELTRFLYHRKINYYISVDHKGAGRRYTIYTFSVETTKEMLMEIKKRWKDIRIPEGIYEEAKDE